MESIALLIGSSLNAGTLLAIASLGLLLNEKAGIVNLGAEGIMLCAALAGFAITVQTGSNLAGFGVGMLVGALLAGVFGVLVIWLNTNQYATGLALTLFGAGFSAFAGTSYVQAKLPPSVDYSIPVLSELPLLGPMLFRHHFMVYVAVALTLGLIWFLYRTRAGLVLRSVGESPESAHALGYPVRRIRLMAVMAGGGLCGLAGAYVSTVYTPLWVEGMIAGKGWIALALTTFATWRPARVLLRGLPVWFCHHVAVSPAGHGRQCAQPVPDHDALCGHHRGAGPDLAQPGLDPHQHAHLHRQAVLSGLIVVCMSLWNGAVWCLHWIIKEVR